MIQEPFEIKAGDSFKTGCFYMNEDNERVFGYGSSEEMCIHFFFYYPKKSLNGIPFGCSVGATEYGLPSECESTHQHIEKISEVEQDLHNWRTFGEPPATCSF